MLAIGLHLNTQGSWSWSRTDHPAHPARLQLRLFGLRPGRPRTGQRDLRGSGNDRVPRARRSEGQDPLPGVDWGLLEADAA